MSFVQQLGFSPGTKIRYQEWLTDPGLRTAIQNLLSQEGYAIVHGGPVCPGDEVLSTDGSKWEPSVRQGRTARDTRYRIVRRRLGAERTVTGDPNPNWDGIRDVDWKPRQTAVQTQGAQAMNSNNGTPPGFMSRIGDLALTGVKAQLGQKALDVCRQVAIKQLSESSPIIAGILATPEGAAIVNTLIPLAFMAGSHYNPNNKTLGAVAGLLEPGFQMGVAQSTGVVLDRFVEPMVQALLTSGILGQLASGTPGGVDPAPAEEPAAQTEEAAPRRGKKA